MEKKPDSSPIHVQNDKKYAPLFRFGTGEGIMLKKRGDISRIGYTDF
jgi:hypothetical protein